MGFGLGQEDFDCANGKHDWVTYTADVGSLAEWNDIEQAGYCPLCGEDTHGQYHGVTFAERVAARKATFTEGSQIVLLQTTEDPFHPLPKGLKGTVSHVDDAGTVHCLWENKSTLGAVLEDKIALVSEDSP